MSMLWTESRGRDDPTQAYWHSLKVVWAVRAGSGGAGPAFSPLIRDYSLGRFVSVSLGAKEGSEVDQEQRADDIVSISLVDQGVWMTNINITCVSST